MDSPALMVNLADPSDMRAKLSEAERRLVEYQKESARWATLVEQLRMLTTNAAGSGDGTGIEPTNMNGSIVQSKALGIQDLVVDVVDNYPQPIRAKEVAALLNAAGHDVAAQSVANALWHAAEKTKRIKRVGHGTYASGRYKEPGMSGAEVAGNVVAGVGVGALAAHAISSIAGAK